MRGLIPDLRTPHPLGGGLPAIFQEEDAVAVALTKALDDVLAPVFATLDNLAYYFDPAIAPPDFVDWLAVWVGSEMDETWDVARRRAAVRRAVELHQKRGTAIGLAGLVEIVTGGRVEIVENGITTWSLDAGGPIAGDRAPSLVVVVKVPDPELIDVGRLDNLVATAKPAHVPHRVEVVGDES
jgi:phage tail-like protein